MEGATDWRDLWDIDGTIPDGMVMDHSFEDVQILEYYLEHEPEKRRKFFIQVISSNVFLIQIIKLLLTYFIKDMATQRKFLKINFYGTVSPDATI